MLVFSDAEVAIAATAFRPIVPEPVSHKSTARCAMKYSRFMEIDPQKLKLQGHAFGAENSQ